MKCNFTTRLLKFRKLDNAKCWLGYKTVRTERDKKKINKIIATIVTNDIIEIRNTFFKNYNSEHLL